MEQLNKALETIRKHLGTLSVTQKLLIASLTVIMLMSLFLVSQYAGSPEMVELLPGAPSETQQRALTFVQTSGVQHEARGGAVWVPAELRPGVLAQMGEAGQLPDDTSLIFENMLKTQSWLRSKEENRQLYRVMLQNELERVLSRYAGVRSADVFLDIPEPAGLGTVVRKPRASVTLHAESGRVLPQQTVDAAARMVAGSVAGMDLSSVTIIDGSGGKPRAVTEEGTLTSTTYAEHAAAMEKHFKEKILGLMGHIPGVRVEVTAAVDVARVRAQVQRHLPVGEGTVAVPKRETASSIVEAQSAAPAEPGLRSNVTADVNAGSGAGAGGVRSEQTDEETEFAVGLGVRQETIDDPRGMPTSLVATINVPRSYIEGLLTRELAAAAGGGPGGEAAPPAPAEDQIRARFETERESIEQSVRPHVRTVLADGKVMEGEVVVAMVAGDGTGLGGFGPGVGGVASPAGLGGGGTVGTMLALGSGVIDKALLTLLAAVALGAMFVMVRKAGKRPTLPTPQELVGIPPALETPADLVGEADESETAMAGIEVADDTIKAQKMLEQVSELIQQNPDVAARLVSRWVSVER